MDPDPGTQPVLADLMTAWSGMFTAQSLAIAAAAWLISLASGAEVAFAGLSRPQIGQLQRDPQMWELLTQPQRLLVSLRLIYLSMGLLLSALTVSISRDIPWFGWVGGAILLAALLIPRLLARYEPLSMARRLTPQAGLIVRLLLPASWLLLGLGGWVEKKLRFQEPASLDELKQAIDLTPSVSGEDAGEKEILRGIINLSNVTVRSIMRARVDVMAVEVETTFEDLLQLIRLNSYSRLPVYADNLDQIRGILHIKDLLPYLDGTPPPLTELMRPAYFVPEHKKTDDLLEDFKSQQIHMAVVVDEFGGTAGIVTLEDIMEEIFGEIRDEFDSEDWVYTRLDPHTFIFEGRMHLPDMLRIIGLDDDTFDTVRGGSDSLGGLILALHGKIPEPGNQITWGRFTFTVESVSKNRIVMVKLSLASDSPAPLSA
ncbi:MAG: CBS domain-containing protein [Bacteroidia bacterium]|nr:CBS domain-containing protein [Bacteroidia bacterium]